MPFYNFSLKISLLLLTAILFTNCNRKPASYLSTELKLVWLSNHSLNTPESILYDSVRHQLYVSNINGDPSKKDGQGYISILDTSGNVRLLNWVDGLDAPKGMALASGHLYVSNITEIVEIDIDSAKITARYAIPGAEFLNDLAADDSGNIYVTDSKKASIYKLNKGKISTFASGPELDGCNGLLLENKYLLIGAANSILRADLNSGKPEMYIDSTGPVDGLKALGNQIYVISDWAGAISEVGPGKSKLLLLDKSGEKINAADIELLPGSGLILVPTFFDNRVMAYKLK